MTCDMTGGLCWRFVCRVNDKGMEKLIDDILAAPKQSKAAKLDRTCAYPEME